MADVTRKRTGELIREEGVYESSGGRRLLKHKEAFYREAIRLYRQWKATQGKADIVESSGSDSAGEKSASPTFEEVEEQAWIEIEKYLKDMNPFELQHLVADLLKAMAYHVSWLSPPGNDGGVDIIAHSDPLGIRPPRIKVQVKRQQSKINTDGLKSFLANINEDDVGLYVSIGGFTRDAEDYARSQERRKITLIDTERLVDLWVEFSGKLEVSARKRLPLTPIYFLAPGN